MTYTGVHCLDVIFKWGILTLSTMLDNLISTLKYIYSISVKKKKSLLQKNAKKVAVATALSKQEAFATPRSITIH
jgi:hypothetical protein